MFKIKNLTKLLENEKLNVVDAVKMIKFTLKSSEEINNVNKINDLI